MDRVRYRIVTEDRNSIPYCLAYLLRHLLPFNQVRPDESSNNLIHFRRFVETTRSLKGYIDQLQLDIGLEEDEGLGTWPNRYSGSGYRMINFVMALPVRLDAMPDLEGVASFAEFGPVTHVVTEFQIVDSESAYLNEKGPNSHLAYKQRQRHGVEERLRWGQLRERLRIIRRRDEEVELLASTDHP
jgi:uncharacterized protein (TIGR04552 family)